jgi:MoxR-like ATPase
MTSEEVQTILRECLIKKPKDFIIDPLQWKYLVRSVLRGKNIMFVGPSRSGKTKGAQSVAIATDRQNKYFSFNLGSTQDARATLIGNTFFKKDQGTIFSPSEFVKAIQTKGAIILLDELSRGHHDAWNILMPVLDSTQRILRLDETENSAVIKVADGVTFIATANVGNEYTATKVMDKALTLRFPVIIEMRILTAAEELSLLHTLYPDSFKEHKEAFNLLCKISGNTKTQAMVDDARINTFIPTGLVVEMAELIIDGFSVPEIAETMIYPLYPDDGGAESERTFIRALIQKYLDVRASKVNSPINDPIVESVDGKVRAKF